MFNGLQGAVPDWKIRKENTSKNTLKITHTDGPLRSAVEYLYPSFVCFVNFHETYCGRNKSMDSNLTRTQRDFAHKKIEGGGSIPEIFLPPTKENNKEKKRTVIVRLFGAFLA